MEQAGGYERSRARSGELEELAPFNLSHASDSFLLRSVKFLFRPRTF
jgi:hypothetical protein